MALITLQLGQSYSSLSSTARRELKAAGFPVMCDGVKQMCWTWMVCVIGGDGWLWLKVIVVHLATMCGWWCECCDHGERLGVGGRRARNEMVGRDYGVVATVIVSDDVIDDVVE